MSESPDESPASNDAATQVSKTEASPVTMTDEASFRDILLFVLPFALFLILTSFEGTAEEQGWYTGFYTLKIAVVTVALVFCRSAFPNFSTRGLLLGSVLGVVGTVVWVALAWLDLEAMLRDVLPTWIMAGPRAGFNPFGEDGLTLGAILFVAVRLIGLAIIVPLMEELFWRGFTIRYLTDANFRKVPYGEFTFFAFAFVTLAFMLVHTEWTAALVWGAAINLLLYQTKNLWACIAMHAVTNALLGAYILSTGNWQLW